MIKPQKYSFRDAVIQTVITNLVHCEGCQTKSKFVTVFRSLVMTAGENKLLREKTKVGMNSEKAVSNE